MRTLILLSLSAMLTACASVDIARPSVTVDVTRLESLPPGAGYTILTQQADGLAETYRELGAKGMNVGDALQGICRFNAAADRVVTRSGAYAPVNMELWAFQVKLEGGTADMARAKGWPVTRTEVLAGKTGPTRGTNDLCGVTTIIEDGMTPVEVEQQLVRIFSAGRQLGMKLSCMNIAC